MSTHSQIEQAIATQERLRGVIPDEIIEATIDALKAQLAALESVPATPKQQRKQITVLFADVSGFTAMSETMDAEDVSETMNALWRKVDVAIVKHGGHIDKHIGDAVMALWGVDEARESDPEQALRGALAMQKAIRQFAEMHNVPLKMRIGINTGLVLLGEVGTTGEFTAMGDTVNTASRLEHAAPIGQILISHDTYRHVQGVFDVTPQEPLRVKGKREPLQVYLVKRIKPRTFRLGMRGVEGIETKTIGREQELRQIQELFQTAALHWRTTSLTLFGEAGVGKSRILFEFTRWLELQPELVWYFKGRASQHGQGVPYYLLRDMLAARFQILDSDPLPAVRQKLISGLASFLPEETIMKAEIMGSWLGYNFDASEHVGMLKDEPEQIKNRATLYLAQLLAAMGAQQPLVIQLEDAQWADGSSLDVLTELAQRETNLPLLILFVVRPSFYERRPTWGDTLPQHTRLDIRPLNNQAVQALVNDILRLVKTVPPILLELITNRAEGNPFYAEELIKMLIDNGVIRTGEAQWEVVADQLLSLDVPATLTGILQARLDRLKATERQTLQQASVIGRVFWDAAVSTLTADSRKSLPKLHQKEFIFPQPESSFDNTAEYIFKHSLLRDVTYETVLKANRRKYHGLVAEWLAKAAEINGRLDEYAALIGEHYELAENKPEAGVWYGRAGLQAAETYANEEAVRYLTLALKYGSVINKKRLFELLLARESVFDRIGQREAQADDLAELQMLAEGLTVREQATVAIRQLSYARVTSQREAAERYVEKAIALLENSPHQDLLAKTYFSWADFLLSTVSRFQPKHKEAEEKLRLCLEIVNETGDKKLMAQACNLLGWIGYLTRNLDMANRWLKQGIAIAREIGSRFWEAKCLIDLGCALVEFGDVFAAINYQEQGYKIFQEIGEQYEANYALFDLATCHIELNEMGLGVAAFEQSLAGFQRVKDFTGQLWNMLPLANLYLKCRQPEKAERLILRSAEIFEQMNEMAQGETAKWQLLGEIAYFYGDYDRAVDCAKRAMDTQTAEGVLGIAAGAWGTTELEPLDLLGTVAYAQGHYLQAQTYFNESLALALERKPQQPSGKWPREERYIRQHLGKIAIAMKEFETAEQHLQKAIACWHDYAGKDFVYRHISQEWAELARVRLALGDREGALAYAEKAAAFIHKHPDLYWAIDPMHLLHSLWQVLTNLNQPEESTAVLNIAASIIQEYLTQNPDPAAQETYLSQPFHQALWATWKGN